MSPLVFLLIAAIAILVLFLFWIGTPSGKGWMGELIVKIFLRKTKKGKKYVIHDVTIEQNGKTSQIDHILINQKGVFVIETKNYAGRIYGQESQHEWTQVLAFGKVKNKLYNPIKQNNTHIWMLSQVINRNDCFFPIIVFLRATLKVNTETPVGGTETLKRELKKNRNEILTTKEAEEIYNKINDYKLNPRVSSKQHVKNIKEMKQNIESNICPRCGKELVLRTGKHGEFYGCSGYPQCKFIKKNKVKS